MTGDTKTFIPAESVANPAPIPRSLIVCSAGKRIGNLPWLNGLTGFDVALVYYGDEPITPPETKYFLANKDFKIPNFIHLARTHPEVLSYDYFFFVDDDLIFESDVFTAWLNSVIENHLDVSQPSLTPDSKADWPHLKHQTSLQVDYDQFVEVQCFCLSKQALRLSLPFFFMARTGTGLDIAIYLLCQRHKLRSGVIHSLRVQHPHRANEQTVRKQFAEFKSFNPQLSQFIEFCFDEKDTLSSLAFASVNLGDTSPRAVRLLSSVRFVLQRTKRKLNRLAGRLGAALRK